MKAGGLVCVPRSKQLLPFAHIEHNKNAHGNRGEGGYIKQLCAFSRVVYGLFYFDQCSNISRVFYRYRHLKTDLNPNL